MENNIDVKTYIDVLKRRKIYFILPAVIILIVVANLALVMPSTYKATASVLIEQQEILENLVSTTVPGYLEERLQAITKRVLGDDNLSAVVEQFGLYTDLGAENTMQRLVSEMRTNIEIEPITTEVRNEKYAKTMELITSFNVSFQGREPERLAPVANCLASLFLEEDAKDREKKTRTTINFLEKQLLELEGEIKDTEAQLAAFKENHINELPELMELNLKTMEQLERQIEGQNRQIENLINRKIYLEGQLALLEPSMHQVSTDGKRVLTPKEELSVLRSQYLSLSSSLSEEHPDVIKLKKKLAALEGEVSAGQELRQLRHELYDKEHQLALLLERVSPRHPDAIKLSKEVSALKKKVQKLSKKQSVLKAEEEKPENPAYINVQTTITSTKMEIEAAQKELKQLKEKHEDYRGRIASTPKVEQEYLDLQRNYNNAKAKYQEIENRLRGAKEAKGLEESRMGEKFTLGHPATTPVEPFKPNRLAIVLLGIVLAAGAGFGTVSLTEYMDSSVHTADELAQIAGHRVLVVIPYWETAHEISRKRKRIWALVGGSVAIVVLCLVGLNLLYKP
jgi:uncharacterized protein involved in exopolysaccharide biosynthesis